MHLVQVRLQRAALRELAVALGAVEGTHAGVCARVALEVKGVVEALVAEGAKVALDVAVVLHVAVHEPLQLERFKTDLALVFVLRVVDYLHSVEQVNVVVERLVLGVLDAETAVDKEVRRDHGRIDCHR